MSSRDGWGSSLSANPDSDLHDSLLRMAAGLQPGARCGESTAHDECVPHPGALIDGKYRLGRLIGRGGMGWVFEAVHLQTEKTVALKYLRPELNRSSAWIARFEREARAAGKIDHPNVIRIYDVGGVGRSMYIVMEYLRGRSLRERLRAGKLAPEFAIALLLAVMRGVAEAHRQGVIHCDIKPDNIFLSELPDGTFDLPKVLDFGVSQILGPECEFVHELAPPSGRRGTPLYMSIEQLQGSVQDARIDVYALGVVLYEALAGRRPFAARTRDELIAALSSQRPPALRLGEYRYAAQLNQVVMRALSPSPRERYATVAEFARALESVAHAPAASSARAMRSRPPHAAAWRWAFSPLLLLLSSPVTPSAPRPSAAVAIATPARNAEQTLGAAQCEPPPADPRRPSSAPVPPVPTARSVAPVESGRRVVRVARSKPRALPSGPSGSVRALTMLREDF